MSRRFTHAHASGLLTLAGIHHGTPNEEPNHYWPESYVELRQMSPWFRCPTPLGDILMGWRKRVLSIDWSGTETAAEVTKDDVTRSAYMVHAWTYAKAVEYLEALRGILFDRVYFIETHLGAKIPFRPGIEVPEAANGLREIQWLRKSFACDCGSTFALGMLPPNRQGFTKLHCMRCGRQHEAEAALR